MTIAPLRMVAETTRILRGQWLVIPAVIVLLAACSQELVRDQKVTPLPTSPQATVAATEHAPEQVQEPTSTTVVQAREAAPSNPSGESGLEISVVGDSLKFDKPTFSVANGTEVVLVFKNASSVNQHNWVLVRAADKAGVVADGTLAGPDSDWIKPNDPRVIANTKLLKAGEIGEVRFTAPEPGTTYQFVCTFPGHDASGMFGDFEVK